jgi:hypothetical protein
MSTTSNTKFIWRFRDDDTNTECEFSAVAKTEQEARGYITNRLAALHLAYIEAVNTPNNIKFSCPQAREAFDYHESGLRNKLRGIFGIALNIPVATVFQSVLVDPSYNIVTITKNLVDSLHCNSIPTDERVGIVNISGN